MSLTTMSRGQAIYKQFCFKMKAQIGMFSTLAVLQMLAIAVTLPGGNAGGSTSMSGVHLVVDIFTANTVIMFTLLWAAVNSIMILTKSNRESSFPFVTDRLSSGLSDGLFLLVLSVAGGITAILSGFLIRSLKYYIFTGETFLNLNSYQVDEVVSGTVGLIGMIVLVCSLGYLLGAVSSMHRLFPVLVPVICIGSLIVIGQTGSTFLMDVINFYFQETGILMYLLKAGLTAILLFGVAVMLLRRLEVRS